MDHQDFCWQKSICLGLMCLRFLQRLPIGLHFFELRTSQLSSNPSASSCCSGHPFFPQISPPAESSPRGSWSFQDLTIDPYHQLFHTQIKRTTTKKTMNTRQLTVNPQEKGQGEDTSSWFLSLWNRQRVLSYPQKRVLFSFLPPSPKQAASALGGRHSARRRRTSPTPSPRGRR